MRAIRAETAIHIDRLKSVAADMGLTANLSLDRSKAIKEGYYKDKKAAVDVAPRNLQKKWEKHYIDSA